MHAQLRPVRSLATLGALLAALANPGLAAAQEASGSFERTLNVSGPVDLEVVTGSGRDLGESSLIDFRILAGVVASLEGGVWMNLGSAVMMPEVFLKAVSVARNLGRTLKEFTTVNLDMIQHYRPKANVLARPKGKAMAITGHHEILLPLVRAGVVAALEGRAIRP